MLRSGVAHPAGKRAGRGSRLAMPVDDGQDGEPGRVTVAKLAARMRLRRSSGAGAPHPCPIAPLTHPTTTAPTARTCR